MAEVMSNAKEEEISKRKSCESMFKSLFRCITGKK